MTKSMSAVLAGLLLNGCASTATISRINGVPLEAEIVRSNRDELIVKTSGGPEASVKRSDVSDVDHPGNALAVVGAALSAYGALNVATGVGRCSEEGGAFCTGVFLPLGVGIPLLVSGLVTWNKSKDAAGNFMPPQLGSTPVPPAPAAFAFSGASGGRSPAPAVVSETPEPAGFQDTHWGMSEDEVRSRYPQAQLLAPGALVAQQPVAGAPATLTFQFRSGKLARVRVALAPGESPEASAETFSRFKELLARKYGAPATESERGMTWKPGATQVQLRAPEAPGLAAALVYESAALDQTALDEI